MTYRPPFTVSAVAISRIAEISALIERYVILMAEEDSFDCAKRAASKRFGMLSPKSRFQFFTVNY